MLIQLVIALAVAVTQVEEHCEVAVIIPMVPRGIWLQGLPHRILSKNLKLDTSFPERSSVATAMALSVPCKDLLRSPKFHKIFRPWGTAIRGYDNQRSQQTPVNEGHPRIVPQGNKTLPFLSLNFRRVGYIFSAISMAFLTFCPIVAGKVKVYNTLKFM